MIQNHSISHKHLIIRLYPFISSPNFKSFYKSRISIPFIHFSLYPSRCLALLSNTNACYIQREELFESKALPIQTLANFPIEKLKGEIVLVRIDSNYLLESSIWYNSSSLERTLSTINYLYNAKSKVIIATNWTDQSENREFNSQQSLSDYLSSLLQIKVVPVPVPIPLKHEYDNESIFLLENLSKFKEEFANNPEFSFKLAFNASIFVNDAFYISHKMLSSTVGAPRFCHVSLAGFDFEFEFHNLLKLVDTANQPYFAIIGGNNFLKKARALQQLASKCDGLIFVGKLGFQIMNGLDLPVPERYIEKDSIEEVKKLIEIAQNRDIPIIHPIDFSYYNNDNTETLSSDEILNGWCPIDIGPKTLEKIISSVSSCKKILWIGPSNLSSPLKGTFGTHSLSQLARTLDKSSKNGCEVFVAGSTVCDAFARISMQKSNIGFFKSTSVVWEFLKGRVLPGIAALDKAYPYTISWSKVYSDPNLPLIVDIGSGNGLFLFQMAKNMKDSNFLGLEMNEKLVNRCLNGVIHSKSNNLHFISTNATSNFRPIISSYSGNLVLVTIQCPNPDFNKEEYRWTMVQRALVESIIDLLIINGKVFLQSDIEAVTIGMREQFVKYGRGKMVIDKNEWMEDNPFSVRSDWELHTLARGNPMYRTMLTKTK